MNDSNNIVTEPFAATQEAVKFVVDIDGNYIAANLPSRRVLGREWRRSHKDGKTLCDMTNEAIDRMHSTIDTLVSDFKRFSRDCIRYQAVDLASAIARTEEMVAMTYVHVPLLRQATCDASVSYQLAIR